MLDDIADMRRSQLASVVLPSGRFFTPRPIFWSWMMDLYAKGVTVTDCGTGDGALLEEAAEYGMTMKGVDICRREGQSPSVRLEDATLLSEWSPTHWPLICRPSHDGWANTVVEKASKYGAPSLWVTVARNFDRDLHGYGARCRRLHVNVGEQGERVYFINTPRKPRNFLVRNK